MRDKKADQISALQRIVNTLCERVERMERCRERPLDDDDDASPLSEALDRAKLADYEALRADLADARDTIAEQSATICALRDKLREIGRMIAKTLEDE